GLRVMCGFEKPSVGVTAESTLGIGRLPPEYRIANPESESTLRGGHAQVGAPVLDTGLNGGVMRTPGPTGPTNSESTNEEMHWGLPASCSPGPPACHAIRLTDYGVLKGEFRKAKLIEKYGERNISLNHLNPVQDGTGEERVTGEQPRHSPAHSLKKRAGGCCTTHPGLSTWERMVTMTTEASAPQAQGGSGIGHKGPVTQKDPREHEGAMSANSGWIVVYELGVIVCAGLGLLFVVLMPLVGFCFSVCRCYNKCGGEMHQRQKKNGPFLKKCFAVSLLGICVFGILCGFVANQYLRTQIKRTGNLVNSNFKDLRTLLNEIPEQVKYATGQFNTTKTRVFSDLDDIKSLLGGGIQEQLRPKVTPVLDNVMAMAEGVTRTRDALLNLNMALADAKNTSARLSASLQDLRQGVEDSLGDPACSQQPGADVCDGVRGSLGQLGGNTNLDQLPSLDKYIDSINGVLQTNFSGLVQEGNKSFNNIPEVVQEQTVDIISDVKSTLNAISSNIDSISEQVAFQDKVSVFSDYINHTETYINHYLPLVEKYDLYRWLAGLIVCEVLTIVVVFYCLGLLCGTLGYDPSATPARRGCISNTGGLFLMVGVGVSFLVCWVIMAFVVLTFVVGGNVEKLVCEPYHNRKLFQLLDTPYLINEKWRYYLSGLVLNNPNITLTFEQVYSMHRELTVSLSPSDCRNSRGIYATFKLENRYNVSEHLNIEKYTSSISKEFENLNINVGNVVLLDEAGRRSLLDFSSSGVDSIDYPSFLAVTSKAPTKVDLLSFAADLDVKVRKLPPGKLKESLKSHVQTLRDLHRDQVIPLQQKMVKVNSTLASLDSAQDFITKRTSAIIVEESKKYVDTVIIGHFERYLRWVRDAITEQMASCKPVANALDSAVGIFLCGYIISPLNLFWFGIGKATFFLIPALIFAVKLAKYYRCMDSEDVYDEGENPAPRRENVTSSRGAGSSGVPSALCRCTHLLRIVLLNLDPQDPSQSKMWGTSPQPDCVNEALMQESLMGLSLSIGRETFPQDIPELSDPVGPELGAGAVIAHLPSLLCLPPSPRPGEGFRGFSSEPVCVSAIKDGSGSTPLISSLERHPSVPLTSLLILRGLRWHVPRCMLKAFRCIFPQPGSPSHREHISGVGLRGRGRTSPVHPRNPHVGTPGLRHGRVRAASQGCQERSKQRSRERERESRGQMRQGLRALPASWPPGPPPAVYLAASDGKGPALRDHWVSRQLPPVPGEAPTSRELGNCGSQPHTEDINPLDSCHVNTARGKAWVLGLWTLLGSRFWGSRELHFIGVPPVATTGSKAPGLGAPSSDSVPCMRPDVPRSCRLGPSSSREIPSASGSALTHPRHLPGLPAAEQSPRGVTAEILVCPPSVLLEGAGPLAFLQGQEPPGKQALPALPGVQCTRQPAPPACCPSGHMLAGPPPHGDSCHAWLPRPRAQSANIRRSNTDAGVQTLPWWGPGMRLPRAQRIQRGCSGRTGGLRHRLWTELCRKLHTQLSGQPSREARSHQGHGSKAQGGLPSPYWKVKDVWSGMLSGPRLWKCRVDCRLEAGLPGQAQLSRGEPAPSTVMGCWPRGGKARPELLPCMHADCGGVSCTCGRVLHVFEGALQTPVREEGDGAADVTTESQDVPGGQQGKAARVILEHVSSQAVRTSQSPRRPSCVKETPERT
ncbi:Prominin-1, partial [Galemys pyrenaicus]